MDDQDLTLSVVATSRNDDHGANLLRRMQTFTNAFVNQCKRHGLRAELILVEWNPPADRPRLARALRWPADPSPCEVRIIEVPESIHRRFRYSAALPLYQMIAKNAGIRRARGRFVLATNIDILFNDELIRFLRDGQLERGKLYRIDRADVETDVPQDAPVEEQLAYCRTHHIRINSQQGTYPLAPDGHRVVAGEDIATRESRIVPLDGFSILERDAGGELYRWAGGDVSISVLAPAGPRRRLLVDLTPGPCVARLPMELEVRDGDEVVARGKVFGRSVVSLALPIAPGEAKVFRFRAPDGGLPAPDWDPRFLDFAVHRLAWAAPDDAHAGFEGAFKVIEPELAPARDVTSRDAGIRLGQGWHPLRRAAGLRFRWGESGASLTVRPRGGADLKLEMWLGATSYARFGGRATVQVRDENDRVLGEARLGLVPARLAVPAPDGAGPARLFLHVLEDGRPVTGRQTARAFVLHSCRWSDDPWPGRVAEGLRARLTGLGLLGRRAGRALARALSVKGRRAGGREARRTEHEYEPPRMHTNACGDFTLLAREDWFALRGYSELDVFSLHLDSLFLYAAHFAGFEEVTLAPPMRAYHIEHSAGSGWTPEGERALFERLRKKGIAALSCDDLCDMARSMQERDDPLLFSTPDWGLVNDDLPETRIGAGETRRAA